MKTKIKDIYQRLTKKELENDDSVISPAVFSSVLLDRFNSELSKMGIIWDKNPTTVNALTMGKSNGSTSEAITNITTMPIQKSDNSFDIGVDLQRIDKFPVVKDPWEDQFYIENFNETEIAYCLKKENPFQSLAGIFAAKEAIFKATGIDRKNISITYTEGGKPFCEFAALSISHDGDYANAVAMVTDRSDANLMSTVQEKVETKTIIVKEKEGKFNIASFFSVISFVIIILYIVYKEWWIFQN